MQRILRVSERKIAIDGARLYAEADKSDPFAFSRAMTHINNGVASIRIEADGTESPAYYDATLTSETRTLSNGEKYVVRAFNNRRRP